MDEVPESFAPRRRRSSSAQSHEESADPNENRPDAYAASHRAVAELKSNSELPKRVPVRTSKYLNNLIEQDHRELNNGFAQCWTEEFHLPGGLYCLNFQWFPCF
jgi:hypothetical protein